MTRRPELPSTQALRAALAAEAPPAVRGRGPDLAPRGPADPVVVSVQPPTPGAVWQAQGGYVGERLAVAAARRLETAWPAGTVVRAARGPRLFWLGVVRASGEVTAVRPPASGAGMGVRNWVEAWEGPGADAPWMLRQCAWLPRPRLVRVACALARLALGHLPPGESRPREALASAEAWALGKAPLELVRREAVGALLAVEDHGGRARLAAASAAAASAAALADSREGVAEACAEAAKEAAYARRAEGASFAEARAALAPTVRRRIPLGVVLLSRAEAGV